MRQIHGAGILAQLEPSPWLWLGNLDPQVKALDQDLRTARARARGGVGEGEGEGGRHVLRQWGLGCQGKLLIYPLPSSSCLGTGATHGSLDRPSPEQFPGI